MDQPTNVRALRPTPDPAPGLDPLIVSSDDPASVKYRQVALTYLRGEPSETDLRQAEIYTGLANAAATAELAKAITANRPT